MVITFRFFFYENNVNWCNSCDNVCVCKMLHNIFTENVEKQHGFYYIFRIDCFGLRFQCNSFLFHVELTWNLNVLKNDPYWKITNSNSRLHQADDNVFELFSNVAHSINLSGDSLLVSFYFFLYYYSYINASKTRKLLIFFAESYCLVNARDDSGSDVVQFLFIIVACQRII